MNGRFLLALLGLCGIFLTGCTVYDPSLLPSTPTVPGQAPPRPDLSTSDMSDSGQRAYAITNIVLDQTQNSIWKSIGLNLDDLVTQGDGTPNECKETSQTADGNDGIDNRFGESLWPVIRGKLPSLECEVNWAHNQGHGTLIIQIDKWNGLANDASLVASIVPSVDGTSPMGSANVDCNRLDANDELTDAGGTLLPAPGFDSSMPDSFCLNPDGLAGKLSSGLPLVRDTNAYMSGGSLVLTIPETADFTLYSTRSSVKIRLGQGQMVVPMDGMFESGTDGFVGGRFSIANLTDVGPDIGVCDQAEIMSYYTDYADIMATKPDVVDPMATCDAISIGVRFDVVRALVAGTSNTVVSPVQLCDMAGSGGTITVPYPVDACCDALTGSDPTACHCYLASMP